MEPQPHYPSHQHDISEATTVYPGDLAIEERLASMIRWNAMAMVAKANAAYGELGGHIASYASAADLFEVGFNHFFKARNENQKEDLVFFQPIVRQASTPEPSWRGV
jgi:pyruvate dehydrogenase E1 component